MQRLEFIGGVSGLIMVIAVVIQAAVLPADNWAMVPIIAISMLVMAGAVVLIISES